MIGEWKQEIPYDGLPGPSASHVDGAWYPFLGVFLKSNKRKGLLTPKCHTAFINLL